MVQLLEIELPKQGFQVEYLADQRPKTTTNHAADYSQIRTDIFCLGYQSVTQSLRISNSQIGISLVRVLRRVRLHSSRDWFNLNDNAIPHFPMLRIRWVRVEVPDPFLDLEMSYLFVRGGLFVVHNAADSEELLAEIDIPTHRKA